MGMGIDSINTESAFNVLTQARQAASVKSGKEDVVTLSEEGKQYAACVGEYSSAETGYMQRKERELNFSYQGRLNTNEGVKLMEESLGIDGSEFASPVLLANTTADVAFEKHTPALSEAVNTTNKFGTTISVFTAVSNPETSPYGQLMASITKKDGSTQSFAIDKNTIISESAQGGINVSSFENRAMQGTEGDDVLISLNADTIDAKSGNDLVISFSDLTKRIDGGDGNDTIISGIIGYQGEVNGGNGDDTILASYTDSTARINTGEGNNTVKVRNLNATVTTGDGDNTISASTYMLSTSDSSIGHAMQTGNGNDTISFSYVGKSVKIDTGSGDDTIKIETLKIKAAIDTGNGNDNVTIGAVSGVKINTGGGDDTVNIGTLKGISRIDMGDGNDEFTADSIQDTGEIITADSTVHPEHKRVFDHEISMGEGGSNFSVGDMKDVKITLGSGSTTMNVGTMETTWVNQGDSSKAVSGFYLKKYGAHVPRAQGFENVSPQLRASIAEQLEERLKMDASIVKNSVVEKGTND